MVYAYVCELEFFMLSFYFLFLISDVHCAVGAVMRVYSRMFKYATSDDVHDHSTAVSCRCFCLFFAAIPSIHKIHI